jgi:hypothetical protein
MGTLEVNFRTQIAEEMSRMELIDRLCEYHERIKHLNEQIESFESIKMSNGIRLAKLVISILDKKAHKGCTDKSWPGFQNGNGEEIGVDIDRIVDEAKKLLNQSK